VTESPIRLRQYYGAKSARARVGSMLAEHGDMNTHQTLDRYNQTLKHSITMRELSRILAGDSRFTKTGMTSTRTLAGKKYPITVWNIELEVA